MKESTRTKALEALDGMAQIVKREMTGRVGYVSSDVYDKQLAAKGALCQGRKYCAVGSLWVGAGVRLKKDSFGNVFLPGVEEEDRRKFLANRHALRAAYDALNESASQFAQRTGSRLSDAYEAPVEALFEAAGPAYGPGLDRATLLTVINSAKRRVRATA